MGPNYDDGAVVDSRLRVYGAYALYIALSFSIEFPNNFSSIS